MITDAYNNYMEENNLDALLMPPVALPAPPHGMIGASWLSTSSYDYQASIGTEVMPII